MGLRDRFSNYVMKKVEKRSWFDDMYGNSIRYNGRLVNDESILESSDVYELMQDISNQVALAEAVVIGPDGNEIPDHFILQVLRNPNNYLTGHEFAKLETNALLINGENFPVLNGDTIHLAANVQTELDENLIEHFKINGQVVPGHMIRHVKNMGVTAQQGVGILQLAKNTLKGVMSAEKVLTDKYTKGGLLAFMLKLDAHINPSNGVQSKLVKRILKQLESIDESNSVKMIPLGKGYGIETLKSPVDDAIILNYLGVYKKDLGKFLGINVDTYQALMKNDLEKAMMYLHNKSIRPILKNKSEHYSALFFGSKSGYRVEWKINILDFVPYSTKTNIAFNIVRTGITSPDIIADKFLGLPKQNTPESQAIYISNDLSKIGEKNATDDSLKGGENNAKKDDADV